MPFCAAWEILSCFARGARRGGNMIESSRGLRLLLEAAGWREVLPELKILAHGKLCLWQDSKSYKILTSALSKKVRCNMNEHSIINRVRPIHLERTRRPRAHDNEDRGLHTPVAPA